MVIRKKAKQINQDKLTDECWAVQLQGFTTCLNCPFRDTGRCGGKEIVKTGKNSKGYNVPI